MRTLLKVIVPVEAANAAIRDGRLQQTMRSLMERINVEFTPVMNADELRAGLQAAGQQSF